MCLCVCVYMCAYIHIVWRFLKEILPENYAYYTYLGVWRLSSIFWIVESKQYSCLLSSYFLFYFQDKYKVVT